MSLPYEGPTTPILSHSLHLHPTSTDLLSLIHRPSASARGHVCSVASGCGSWSVLASFLLHSMTMLRRLACLRTLSTRARAHARRAAANAACHHVPVRSLGRAIPNYSFSQSPPWSEARWASTATAPGMKEATAELGESEGEGASVSAADAVANIERLTALKAERREMHKLKFERAANEKELKRHTSIADDLMRIFAGNDECFNMTLRELGVDRKWGSDSGLSEYRQFYLESLRSFGTMLAEDQDDESVLAPLGLSGSMAKDILEQFAAGRSANEVSAFTKGNLKMTRFIQREEDLRANLEKCLKRREQLLDQLKNEEAVLKSMVSELAREKAEKMAKTVASAREVLPNLEKSKSYTDELDRLEEELGNFLSQISETSQSRRMMGPNLAEQKSKVDDAKTEAALLDKRASAIESKIDEFKWPMTQQEFQLANEACVKIAESAVPALAKFIVNRDEDFRRYRQMEMHTDLTSPHEWYPRARLDKRKIIFHAGPTNSGKTYSALQRLKQAERGMYLAPLRLLGESF
ncbi:hypothetical protein ACHAWF_009266 [Thalassiosira exigua]